MTITAGEDQLRGSAPPWVPSDETFGARLALVRQHMGWGNIAEAALACGLPANSWRNWERDNRTPMKVVEIARAIADRTGCDYGWLLAGPRMAGVYRPTGPTNPGGSPQPEASVRTIMVTEKSGRTGYPDRVRPRDSRPPGHPQSPVVPPIHRRPARRPRTVVTIGQAHSDGSSDVNP